MVFYERCVLLHYKYHGNVNQIIQKINVHIAPPQIWGKIIINSLKWFAYILKKKVRRSGQKSDKIRGFRFFFRFYFGFVVFLAPVFNNPEDLN